MSALRKSSRHRSREVALQVLYAIDVGEGRGKREGDPKMAFEQVAANFEMPEGARAFAEELVNEAHGRRAELDALISEHARNWRIDRMGTLDRNVLRLATWELSHTDTPAPVILDEAVELARRYGTDSTPAFVNGILDAVARATRGVDA